MASSSDSMEKQLTIARLAEQAERYNDMKDAMVKYVKESNTALEVEHRNLLSVAFKNIVGGKRSSYRTLCNIQQKENGERKSVCVNNAITKVRGELELTCDEMLKLIDTNLIPNNKDDEASVFYHKMKGDYYRYLAEGNEESGRSKHIEDSEKAYEEAQTACDALNKTNPIRLGLALNFSVFYYEIRNEQEKACTLARKAFEDAISELDNLEESKYKDSTLIMQLLRDNLTLWTSETQEDGQDDD